MAENLGLARPVKFVGEPHDLLQELKRYIKGEATAVVFAILTNNPIPSNVDSPRLREAIEKLQDQWLENRVDIDQLRSGRGRPPNKGTLIREAFVQALQEGGVPDDQISKLFDRFQSIYEPATAATQRQRRRRVVRDENKK